MDNDCNLMQLEYVGNIGASAATLPVTRAPASVLPLPACSADSPLSLSSRPQRDSKVDVVFEGGLRC